MKTHYDLLGLDHTADRDQIRQAFRREIARYHPDKVQHLGPEFQEMASTRAAALTAAYRVLCDPAERERYDDSLGGAADRPARGSATTPADSASEPAVARSVVAVSRPTHARGDDLVRRAVMLRMEQAVAQIGGAPVRARFFDAVFDVNGRQALFRKSEPGARIAVKFVAHVDPPAVDESWTAALRIANGTGPVCVLLLGQVLAPARDLAASVAALRRKTRSGVPVMIPVDVRDWETLLPPETPAPVRSLLDNLRAQH